MTTTSSEETVVYGWVVFHRYVSTPRVGWRTGWVTEVWGDGTYHEYLEYATPFTVRAEAESTMAEKKTRWKGGGTDHLWEIRPVKSRICPGRPNLTSVCRHDK